MIDDGFRWYATALNVFIAVTFALQGIRGLRSGIASLPLRPFGGDEFKRGETMFGLIISFNFIGALGAACLTYLIWTAI